MSKIEGKQNGMFCLLFVGNYKGNIAETSIIKRDFSLIEDNLNYSVFVGMKMIPTMCTTVISQNKLTDSERVQMTSFSSDESLVRKCVDELMQNIGFEDTDIPEEELREIRLLNHVEILNSVMKL